MDGLILVGVTGGFFAVVVTALCAIAYLTGGPGDDDLPASDVATTTRTRA